MGCGINLGLKTIFHNTQDDFVKLGGDLAYIDVSVDGFNAFSRTILAEILRQTATRSPTLIRFANVIYAKCQPHMRFGDKWLRNQKGTQKKDPASFLMFALSIHFIVQRIEAQCDLFVCH